MFGSMLRPKLEPGISMVATSMLRKEGRRRGGGKSARRAGVVLGGEGRMCSMLALTLRPTLVDVLNGGE
jgi:hypothetical protein